MYFVESSQKALVESDPTRMAHGTDFPIGLLERYLDKRSFLVDVGCGSSGEKIRELERRGFHPRGVDINVNAVSILLQGGLWASIADARLFGSGDLLTEIRHIETEGGMMCQGLFPSLLGDSWKSA